MSNNILPDIFENIVNNNCPVETKIINWNGAEISVKPMLSIEEMAEFVSQVVSGYFAGEDDAYSPEFGDFAKKYGIITYYTNIILPSSTAKQYDLITRASSLIDEIIAVIDVSQFNAISLAIIDKVNLINKMNLNEFQNKTKILFDKLSELENGLSEIFAGISNDDISSFIKAISEGQIDEEKLMNAYLKQKR